MDVEVCSNYFIGLLVSIVAVGSIQVDLSYGGRVIMRTDGFSKDHIRIVSNPISCVAVWSPVIIAKDVVVVN